MGERGKKRAAMDRVAKRIKEHADIRGGAMTSATEAQRRAAEVARDADAQREAGALDNPNRGRAKRMQEHHEEPRRPKPRGPRIFIDLGKKG